jgi:hypothetical protein
MEKVVPLLKPFRTIFYFYFFELMKVLFGPVKNLEGIENYLNLLEFEF